MRVYLSVDMEGVSNVVMTYQLFPKGRETAMDDIRENVTREVNAAIEGAFEAGATEVLVNENHTGREIIPSLLDRRAFLMSGKPKFMMTAQDIERFDTLFLLGIHPRAGTLNGVMDHTWNPKELLEFRVNGKPIGEIGLNALYAANFDVPVSLVTGDEAACAEALELLGNVETVAVKRGLGRYTACCPHPEVNYARIKEASRRALERHGDFEPLKFSRPMVLEFDYTTQNHAMIAALVPGAKRVGARSVRFEVPDFELGMRIFCLCGYLAGAATDETY